MATKDLTTIAMNIPPQLEADTRDTGLSQFSKLMFLAFMAFLVMPLFDIPFLGLSASAPLIILIGLNLIFSPRTLLFKNHPTWFLLGIVIWLGGAFSLGGNLLLGNISSLELDDLILLGQYAFWIFCTIVTMYVIAHSTIAFNRRLLLVLGIMALILGAARLFEAVIFGKWGAWTEPIIMTQNTYGLQFSTFASSAIGLLFIVKGRRLRLLAVGGLFVLFVAIMGNGSRSSWITLSTQILIMMGILFASQKTQTRLRIIMVAVVLISIAVTIVSILPEEVLAPITARALTLENVEEDKSFAVRLVLVQKAELLFERNQLFGVGLGHFRSTFVADLEIPTLLSYQNLSFFNHKSPHNSYMALLAETGLFGIIPYAIMLAILVIGGGLATYHLACNGELWPIFLYCGFVGMSIHLWSLAGLTGTGPWVIYGVVAGIIERSASLRRKQRQEYLTREVARVGAYRV